MSTEELIPKAKNILLSGTVVVTVGILISAFFGYLLQFFLGRFLSVEDFGTFNALLSLTYLIGVPSAVLGTSIIKVTSELAAKDKYSRLSRLFWRLSLYFLAAGVTMFLLLYLLKGVVGTYLNVSDFSVFIPFGIFLGLSYLNIIPVSYLQGLLRFKAFAFHASFMGLIRFVIPALLVLMGLKVSGVFYGFAAYTILSYMFATFLLKKNFKKFRRINLEESYKRIFTFSISVIFINFGLMILSNIDMIMVKRFFDPEIAGYYAGTVTLGKIYLFGAGTITTVMFPQISNLYTKKSKDLYKKFKKFIFIQMGLVGGGLLVFSVFPRLLTLLFFGQRFINSVEYLPRFSIFIAFYILINFMVIFFMAVEKTRVFLFLIPAALIQYILIRTFHNSIIQVIDTNIAITSVLTTILILYFLRVKKEHIF